MFIFLCNILNCELALSLGHLQFPIAGGFKRFSCSNSSIISTVNECQEDRSVFYTMLNPGNSSTRQLLVFPNRHGILASMLAVDNMALVV